MMKILMNVVLKSEPKGRYVMSVSAKTQKMGHLGEDGRQLLEKLSKLKKAKKQMQFQSTTKGQEPQVYTATAGLPADKTTKATPIPVLISNTSPITTPHTNTHATPKPIPITIAVPTPITNPTTPAGNDGNQKSP